MLPPVLLGATVPVLWNFFMSLATSSLYSELSVMGQEGGTDILRLAGTWGEEEEEEGGWVGDERGERPVSVCV